MFSSTKDEGLPCLWCSQGVW